MGGEILIVNPHFGAQYPCAIEFWTKVVGTPCCTNSEFQRKYRFNTNEQPTLLAGTWFYIILAFKLLELLKLWLRLEGDRFVYLLFI